MTPEMSQKSKDEILRLMRWRYAQRGREGRVKLLDEFCVLCGYERKYAIKLLGGWRRSEGQPGRKGGSIPRNGEAECTVLKAIWMAAEQPCKTRLKAAEELWPNTRRSTESLKIGFAGVCWR